ASLRDLRRCSGSAAGTSGRGNRRPGPARTSSSRDAPFSQDGKSAGAATALLLERPAAPWRGWGAEEEPAAFRPRRLEGADLLQQAAEELLELRIVGLQLRALEVRLDQAVFRRVLAELGVREPAVHRLGDGLLHLGGQAFGRADGAEAPLRDPGVTQLL